MFKIETSELDSASDAIGNVVSEVSTIADTVSGHDVSLDGDVENGDWDFDGVKSTIKSNLEACSTKIKNISTALDSVSQSHTELQNSLKFEDPTSSSDSSASASGSDGTSSGSSDGTSSGSSGGSSGGSSYSGGGGGGGYSGGGGGGGYSGGDYSGGAAGGYLGGAAGIAGTSVADAEKETEEDSEAQNRKEDDEELKTVEVENKFTKVGYAYPDKENLSDESKKVFDDSEFDYDDDGYARIGERYVIAADESVGKVGDVVKFTQKDGTVVETVIGINTTSDKYKDNINFIVSSDKANDFKSTDLTKTLLENNDKIENCGNYKLLDKKLAEETGVMTLEHSTEHSNEIVEDSIDGEITETLYTRGTEVTTSSTSSTGNENIDPNFAEVLKNSGNSEVTATSTNSESTTTVVDKPETIVTPVDNPNSGSINGESEEV